MTIVIISLLQHSIPIERDIFPLSSLLHKLLIGHDHSREIERKRKREPRQTLRFRHDEKTPEDRVRVKRFCSNRGSIIELLSLKLYLLTTTSTFQWILSLTHFVSLFSRKKKEKKWNILATRTWKWSYPRLKRGWKKFPDPFPLTLPSFLSGVN